MPVLQNLFYYVSLTGLMLLVILWGYFPFNPWVIGFSLAGLLIIGVGLYDLMQKKHTLLRLYPVMGHFRYIFEGIRPEIQQYFVEDNLNGTPVNREFRSLIYQRAKGKQDTRPFGTQFDVYRIGFEWVNHSMNPKPILTEHPGIIFGEGRCQQPYVAALLNISAMSYGALSQHAILALNKGAKLGGFYHNTGEGGLSPYHLEPGGDLVWQIGTGYFSCRNAQGDFDETLFAEKSHQATVKMIEIKLSQGAKPGHGGVLPKEKLTHEIAEIRKVPMGEDVLSPPAHSAFSNPVELLQFVAKLRTLSGGKPVGFKLNVGKKSDFIAICKAMISTEIVPDFITVDGAEGGTGAAPIEFTNSIGTPLKEGLWFVHNTLVGFGIREKLRIIASGKSFSAFHLYRLLALGADTVNSARGMMFALGCVQSRSCNTGQCPTGVATQDPSRYKFLDIEDKAQRVANYQQSVVHHFLEILGATGKRHIDEVQASDVQRRVSPTEVLNLEEIYGTIPHGSLLDEETVPSCLLKDWQKANPTVWE